MGAELFEMSWVQSVVLFFSYLGWALYAVGLVVACFECGVEYSSGRGNVRETVLNAFKGFLAVELFTQSAEQKNEYAAYQLGRLYFHGDEGIPKDMDKALFYLQASAELGNEYAQSFL